MSSTSKSWQATSALGIRTLGISISIAMSDVSMATPFHRSSRAIPANLCRTPSTAISRSPGSSVRFRGSSSESSASILWKIRFVASCLSRPPCSREAWRARQQRGLSASYPPSIMSRIRSGLAGRRRTRTPWSRSASSIAAEIAAGAIIRPPSPPPLMP